VSRAIPHAVIAIAVLGLASSCTPKIQLEAPKEPIVINMNIKIDHEIRVKVDKDLDELMSEDKEIF